MHAVYMKSVRSPGFSRQNRYKLKYNTDYTNVFSQIDESEEDDCYEQDSFCVDEEECDYEGSLVQFYTV